ncbi:MAG: TetR/AcrR family transcriptional regulator [Pseudodesulfovibrio sp.]|uniref:Regulatory protein TetR n=1 Tax=Pseudodesulfovibrio aespoeensis (strain ATCC 700646 / DSM 10631 / Aspo-2) TaxID=643562 RepID=E6VRW0_PSEA9|nr:MULTISPECIES: TetR/AcrR family transcriptional regulator [Pseudodesulfovibrio]MBU4191788.1 TetR/AcrR family transcriptional regulator [Pseudomonadota bacterium]ADU64247.1 regulatory protein TetR [Pseudodesulfovibrio aespoeensis Aspo-2]MBU4243008.1 TetR/AcrR family transcriptional regulator [Pseudomonadota bacterium]MBU4380297.1 TetR/AcrR family transcriptional regulator [Pseudomonadota bacterium]MBU4474835.1 TetR/AcrR family transcriptional regulator [Pseudomonadota bacterium]
MKTMPRYLPADDRRAMTVRTVLELAATTNPADITTAAIAARMGLAQSALFRHFASKDAIWQATMDWVTGQILERVRRAADQAATPLAALEAAFTAHLEFAMEYPGVPRLVFSELQRTGRTQAMETVQAMLADYRKMLEKVIEQGKAQGEVASEVAAPSAAAMFIGTIQGLIMQAMLTNDMPRLGQAAPAAFALFRRALEAGNSSGSSPLPAD